VPKNCEYFAAKRSDLFFEQLLGDLNLQKVLKVALSVVHNPAARLAERHTLSMKGIGNITKAWQSFVLVLIIGM